MGKNHDSSPFLFSSTFQSPPSDSSESTPPSSPSSSPPPPSPSFCSSRSYSSFNSAYKSSPAVFGPCAACKFHSRRCSEKCYLASFFPPNDAHKFAAVDSVFGSGNADNFLQMENNGWSFEQHNTLIRELIQGMEMAKQLRLHLNSGSSMEARESLIQRILTSYEKALLMLNWSQQQQNAAAASASASAALAVVVAAAGSVPESPISTNGSPTSDDFDGGYVDASKKRKTMPRWTDQVRVSSENGLEGSHDDGYNWRKYGQKDILGAKYPRSYYRCTYRNTQNCWATKQVQRSDEDPNVFDITYRGAHTCSHGQQSVPPPASPEKQEHKQNNINNSYQQQQQQQHQSQETLFNFQKTLRVNTENLDNKEIATLPFSFPPSFISPTTPEPSYYSVSPFHINNFAVGAGNLQYYDSFSTNTSAANSPLAEPDFSLQALELDTNFPFDTPGFFC